MTAFTEGCESTPAVFAGPTCDSVDRLGDHENLPELSLGDVIVIHEIGAYSIATACHFNGIAPPSIIDLEDTSETQLWQASESSCRYSYPRESNYLVTHDFDA